MTGSVIIDCQTEIDQSLRLKVKEDDRAFMAAIILDEFDMIDGEAGIGSVQVEGV